MKQPEVNGVRISDTKGPLPDNACNVHRSDAVEMQKMCISIVPIFNHLDQTELAEIVKATKSLQYTRGEIIYRAGEISDSLYIIHKGQVKIYRLSESGKETLIRILKPGDFTGELALFTTSEHDAYAEAMMSTEICLIARDDLQQYLMSHPSIALRILTEFSTRLDNTEKQAANMATESVETRIALYLAELMEEARSDRIHLPMTRKNLASFLGTSPETISRKLTEFEDASWITQLGSREIQIHDLDALLLL